MNPLPYLFPVLAATATLLGQAPWPLTLPKQPTPPTTTLTPVAAGRSIDLVLCLDISGSMDGLIDSARQHLWSVVNDLARLTPTPTLRVALLSYGCTGHPKERGWVKIETDLTTDLDLVSQLLFALQTNGGDEYVARVVDTALKELQWSQDKNALQLLFVAGNEPATQDPELDALAVARAAIARGIVVDTIYCGGAADPIADGWRQVALAADGKFASIDHSDQAVIVTPFDEQLAALSTQLNGTYVYYGSAGASAWANQTAQDGNALRLNPAAAATRCQTKAGDLYCNPAWDLVDALKQPDFDLSKVKKEDLPEALRAMSPEQLKDHVDTQAKKRADLQKQVGEIGQQRDAFVLELRKKLAERGHGVFEEAMLESVREQAASRGFRVPEPPVERVEAFVPLIEAAVRDYQGFVRVTGEPKRAPTDCRIPGPFARLSKAGQQHGGKLYLLYVRQVVDGDYVKPGQPADVGQTLVKEAWQLVPGKPTGPTAATARYPFGLTMQEAGADYHAGDAYGLFVMHKLAADTPGTDQGWVYGAVDAQGRVTAAGRIASCMRCHQDADEDRRFGLR